MKHKIILIILTINIITLNADETIDYPNLDLPDESYWIQSKFTPEQIKALKEALVPLTNRLEMARTLRLTGLDNPYHTFLNNKDFVNGWYTSYEAKLRKAALGEGDSRLKGKNTGDPFLDAYSPKTISEEDCKLGHSDLKKAVQTQEVNDEVQNFTKLLKKDIASRTKSHSQDIKELASFTVALHEKKKLYNEDYIKNSEFFSGKNEKLLSEARAIKLIRKNGEPVDLLSIKEIIEQYGPDKAAGILSSGFGSDSWVSNREVGAIWDKAVYPTSLDLPERRFQLPKGLPTYLALDGDTVTIKSEEAKRFVRGKLSEVLKRTKDRLGELVILDEKGLAAKFCRDLDPELALRRKPGHGENPNQTH